MKYLNYLFGLVILSVLLPITTFSQNQPPTIANLDSLNGCVNLTTQIAKNIVFNDPEGDAVSITNFMSSDVNVISTIDISASQNAVGNWVITASPSSVGTTTITFDYSDGANIETQSIIVPVVSPVIPSFQPPSMFQVCSNEKIVDFNDYVDQPGGTYKVLLGNQTTNGLFNLEDLSLSTLPETVGISYKYEDQNGCVSTTNSTFIVNDSPSASLIVTNTTCGNSTGSIEADVTSPNGIIDFSYWSTGDQDTSVISNLSAGTYYFNAVDGLGCSTLSQADVEATDFTVTGSITDPSCFDKKDGSINLNVFGGSGNYSVLWSTGHSSANLNNLDAGNYHVIVTDANGCKATRSFDLVNPNKFIIYYTVDPPTCNQANGSLNLVSSSGGSSPFMFNWSTNQGQQTTQDLSGINRGLYTLNAVDNLGCEFQKDFQINSQAAPTASINRIRKPLCGLLNGAIDLDLTASIGQQITGIQWNTGAVTEDVNGLTAGSYECTISQSDGCDAVYNWNLDLARPLKPKICIVTVDTTTNTNLVVWEKPSNNPFNIEYYNIYRETSITHQFKKIDTVHFSSISVFNDVVASPANRSWSYRISAVNSCGVESAPSLIHKTMHLVMKEDAGDVKVIWDNYEGFFYSNYDLLRKTNNQNWTVIQPNISYADLPLFSETPPTLNGLNYMIEVQAPGGGCTATESKVQDYNSARSNKPSSVFNPGEGTGDPNNSLSKEENDSYSVAVYPNPSNGFIEVSVYQKNNSSDLDMSVLDLNGKVVQEDNLKEGVNYLDLSKLNAGIYVLNVRGQKHSETFRIIIR
jgi:hypothetical protein